MVTCPHTYSYVKLTEEVKQKISAEKKPRLAADDAPMGYPMPTKNEAKEKGLRSVIKMKNGQELSIFTLNKAGQNLLGKTLPELYEHMGSDVVDNLEIILC